MLPEMWCEAKLKRLLLGRENPKRRGITRHYEPRKKAGNHLNSPFSGLTGCSQNSAIGTIADRQSGCLQPPARRLPAVFLSLLWAALIIILGACQVFQGSDTQATLEAGVGIYATESADIQRTMALERAQAQATADAVATTVVEMSYTNQQLLATARVFSEPTVAVVPGVASENAAGMAETTGTRQFGEMGTTTAIRQSDGCANSLQSSFSPDTPRIYVTALVQNLAADVLMNVEWLHEGQIVYTDSWVVSPTGGDFCVWYFITPEDVSFAVGNWVVRLLADGAQVGSTVPFAITDNDS
jgi:hypothetical protein